MDRDEENINQEGEQESQEEEEEHQGYEEDEEGEEYEDEEDEEESQEEEEQKEDQEEREDNEKKYFYPEYNYLPNDAVWTRVPLKRFKDDVKHPRVLRFDHYLVIKVDEEDSKRVTLLVVDMRDDSVQEVEVPDKSWFSESDEGSSDITRYKENQIIKLGQREWKVVLSLMTIESFQPLKIKCEEIVADDAPLMQKFTAQVHNDFLYVCGEMLKKDGKTSLFSFSNKGNKDSLWRFDIKNRKWEHLNPAGEAPSKRLTSFVFHKNLLESFYEPLSFVFEDYFYVYAGGGTFDTDSDHGIIFALNLNTMAWSKLTERISLGRYNIDQNIYKGQAIDVDEYPVDYMCGYDEARTKSKAHGVGWWTITPNTPEGNWPQGRPTKKISLDYYLRHTTVVYSNFLIMFGTRWLKEDEGTEFNMFVLDLDNIDMRISKSEEDKRFESLLMKEENSDVTFKVQDKQFPAHKEVLIKKSKYFENLLNSNPTQSVIEIQDCDEQTFKEFLNHLYDDQVHLLKGLDKDLAIRLAIFADKYQQYDLRDRCAQLLQFNLNSKNVLEALGLASELRLTRLKNACLNFLKKKITVDSISMIIKFLESQEEAQGTSEIKANVISFVLENFEEISKKDAETLELCENFLVKNFGIDTLALFAKAAYSDEKANHLSGKWISELSKDDTTDLKLILLNACAKNLREIEKKGLFQDLPKQLLADVVLSVISEKERKTLIN